MSQGRGAEPDLHGRQGREAARGEQQDQGWSPEEPPRGDRSHRHAQVSEPKRSRKAPLRRGFLFMATMTTERRSGRAREIRRARAPLVGPAGRVPAAARPQPAAPGLDRRPGAARRQARARRRLRRRHPRRGDGAAGRHGDGHRSFREAAQGGAAAPARERCCRCELSEEFRGRTGGTNPGVYDVVTCMELLEHVPDPASTVARLREAREARRPRILLHDQPQSEVLPVRGDRRGVPAEACCRKGTHDYARFIKPSELSRWCRDAGLATAGTQGHDLQPGHQPVPPGRRLRASTTRCAARRMPSTGRPVRFRRHAGGHRGGPVARAQPPARSARPGRECRSRNCAPTPLPARAA